MNRPTIRIHDISKDEIVDREMNDEEYQLFLERKKESKNEEKIKEEASAKKKALLDKLGITQEEAELLLS